MLRSLIGNHVLANLAFGLILVLGVAAYVALPREQEPSFNFNWIVVATTWLGASASDIEQRITIPIEEAVEKVKDVKFSASYSRESISNVLVRFNELSDLDFSERLSDLRREVQNKLEELPTDIDGPHITEITSANVLPTAIVLVTGLSDDANLRLHSLNAERDMERFPEVDVVSSYGDRQPEILVEFSLAKMAGLGISPVDLADTVEAYFRDLAAGSITLGDRQWLVRLTGTSNDPGYLSNLPLISHSGEVPLRSVANVVKGRQKAHQKVFYEGRPAVMLTVHRNSGANNLRVVDKIKDYIAEKESALRTTGVKLVLVDDQTAATREAIGTMEANALIGLVLVAGVVWVMLGFRIAVVASIGIPFVLAGVFLCLFLAGQTLNSTALLAVVISLGMLVDDAVVVAEAIDFQLQRGREAFEASILALRETVAPLSSAVLTTLAAFLPLTLMPGILGDYMQIVPLVVSLALLFSLIEAFWILPSHMVAMNVSPPVRSRLQELRGRSTRRFRHLYTRSLLRALASPKKTSAVIVLLAVGAFAALASGVIRSDFFAGDPYRFFYIDMQMPSGTSLDVTAETIRNLERKIRDRLNADEVRAITSYAGLRFTEKAPAVGFEQAQILVTLQPQMRARRGVNQVIDDLRPVVESMPGPANVSFLKRKFGPPTSRPVSLQVKGSDVESVRAATAVVKRIMEQNGAISDITDDDTEGQTSLVLRLNPDGVVRAGLNPSEVVRALRLFVDGGVVASLREGGETIDVRVKAAEKDWQDVDAFMANTVALPDGAEVPLRALIDHRIETVSSDIRHHNLKRAITVEADIDTNKTDTIAVNRWLKREWEKTAFRFPGVELDFTGELDDIKESLQALGGLLLVGVALIYLILGTHFKSYLQPLVVMTSIPMAFVGVLLGLMLSRLPLSLYTLYGVIALAGIVANDAIVLLSAANQRLALGWPPSHAVVFAARRRLMPIVITSVTTIAGLSSLAAGWGRHSLMWGPMATSIVWGLAFSTAITLFLVPFLALLVFSRSEERNELALPVLDSLSRKTGLQRFLGGIAAKAVLVVGGGAGGNTSPEYDIEQAKAYDCGIHALRTRDVELAIRCFQPMADQQPTAVEFNLLAAQACVAWMQIYGYDVGYMVRARRFLRRVHLVDPENPNLQSLDRIARTLDEDSGP